MNVGERLEDEAPVGESWVGKSENVFVHFHIVEVEDIEIDGAGGIPDGGGGAAELPFDALGGFEKIVRLADKIDFDDSVVKIRRIRRTINGLGLVNTRLIISGARGHEIDKEIARLTEVYESITNVCA